jgi:hypothetical protein
MAELGLRTAEAEAAKVSGDDVIVAGDDWKAQLAARAKANDLGLSTGSAKLDKKIGEKLKNPDLALYKLQQTFYKFSFLLIPISIPLVAVLFLWKRGFTLYDHGVFVLYSVTFMSLLLLALGAALRLGPPFGALAMLAAPVVVPAHMFFQLKGAYSLSGFSAAWRTVTMLVFSSIALLFFLLAILWLGMV